MEWKEIGGREADMWGTLTHLMLHDRTHISFRAGISVQQAEQLLAQAEEFQQALAAQRAGDAAEQMQEQRGGKMQEQREGKCTAASGF